MRGAPKFRVRPVFVKSLLKVQSLSNEGLEVWIPKSVILSIYSLDMEGVQQFKIQPDFLEIHYGNSNWSVKKCLDQGYLAGFILKSTEKAHLLRILLAREKYDSLWIPKSVIYNSTSLKERKFQKIHLKKWWIEKVSLRNKFRN